MKFRPAYLMDRRFYLDLAARRVRMPIGTDLVLHENPDVDSILVDGEKLGKVVEGAARRYGTPLAIPLMDLRVEKADLLDFFGVPEDAADGYHFGDPPTPEMIAAYGDSPGRPFLRRMAANLGALRYVAAQTDLVAVGMLIGPFSLMTKLVADPIAPVAMSAAGVNAIEDEGVLMVERCLELALAAVLRSAKAQIGAGAKAILMCEPAANTVYLSPRQLRRGSDIFERFVLAPCRKIRELLGAHDVDLIFHDCGELLTDMVRQFATELRPAILSLGSSRKLWEDAAVVPKDIVLYGNLPTKLFYSDGAMPLESVVEMTGALVKKMDVCGHPYILGSECDVLHVPEAAATIRRKVEAMLHFRSRYAVNI